jgi:hypothetical protein
MTPTLRRRKVAPEAPISRLFLVIRDTVYLVSATPNAGRERPRGYRLVKSGGTAYDVEQTQHGPTCDCPDFVFRRDGLDPAGCKHVRALVAQGLLDEGPVAAVPRR